MITQQEIIDSFEYIDGKLYWKHNARGHFLKGKEAGQLNKYGYYYVVFKQKRYRLHRLIYMYHHGELPQFIDHIDNNPVNNRIENLRPATHKQNMQNMKKPRSNTSGVKNVSWSKAAKKWGVRMTIGNVHKHIGLFEDLELAELVAMEARLKFHKQFARHA